LLKMALNTISNMSYPHVSRYNTVHLMLNNNQSMHVTPVSFTIYTLFAIWQDT
jgi:hypothetical protein